ncbi:MerR family transcriptional regulator [Guptibacillus hwajinpoensis]|uniref:MerR family transcriptional regulator n=1 Tax=Guptibacillus hwajinpoensis TaxID=208199 RepID=A0A0J6CS10_9BACL|nr:MerR family transcriptional regulator [Alkalihalobacillus macyae]KMM39086.1 MerR family transcriptional regulator [Alkalihalobacillus macyae]
MTKQVKEVAELTGVSVRTLHYYDEIDLLTPKTTEAGYRLYSASDLEKLQQILFLKALDIPLKKIKEILEHPEFNRIEALEYQKAILLEKQQRIMSMINTIDKSIQHAKGEINMTDKEKFEGFDFAQNPFEEEARKRYGDEAIDRSSKKLAKLNKDERKELSQTFDELYKKLASLRHGPSTSKEAQEAIHEWYEYLNANFGYTYTLDAFKNLGQMYVDDERFTKNIDRFGAGLAKFMKQAMAIYADSRK